MILRGRAGGAPKAWAFAALLVVLTAGRGAADGDRRGDAERAYQQGNAAYAAGHFSDAVRLYQRARSTGWTSAELEFNEADALLKCGSLGRAIAGYYRARKLGMQGADLDASLRYARSLTRDERPREEVSRLVVLSESVLSAVPVAAMYATGAALLLLWVALWFRARWSRRPVGALAGGLLALGLVCQLGAAGRQAFLDRNQRGVLLGTDVVLRSGPGTDFPAPITLHEGAVVRLGRSAGMWREVQFSSDVVGWVPVSSIEAI